MAQNLYDEEDFFAEYASYPRSTLGLTGAPEWPTLRDMVGSVKGEKVLDLGSGMGWFCRWAAASGANSVEGIDVSIKMITKAKSFPLPDGAEAEILYHQQDLESLTLPSRGLDLVYSSLTLHYLPDLDRTFAQVYQALKPGGRFVFSIEHPVGTAPKNDANFRKNEESGEVCWPLNSYFEEGLRLTTWLGREGVRKYHHTLQTYMTLLLRQGFILKDFREFWDSVNAKGGPQEWGEGQKPDFLLVGVQKPLPDMVTQRR